MIIYKTTNLVNGKQYIGRDSRNNPNYLGSGPLLKKAINKYGRENFKKEIIEECTSFEHLIDREEYWLNYYDASNNPLFYNLQNSGKGVRLIGERNGRYGTGHLYAGELSHMYGKSLSQETKNKIGNSNRGKTRTDDVRKKLSDANRRRKHSQETRKKMSESQKGKVFSEEHRRKLSDAKQGDKHPNFGKKFTIETRKKISESGSKGYIVCLHGNYKNNKYKMKEWCEILCISKSYLSEHLSGKRFKNGIKGNFFKWEHEIQS